MRSRLRHQKYRMSVALVRRLRKAVQVRLNKMVEGKMSWLSAQWESERCYEIRQIVRTPSIPFAHATVAKLRREMAKAANEIAEVALDLRAKEKFSSVSPVMVIPADEPGVVKYAVVVDAARWVRPAKPPPRRKPKYKPMMGVTRTRPKAKSERSYEVRWA